MKKYIRNNKTITGRLDDELVMMDIDKGKYFSLNPVATRIWELLEDPRDLDELRQLLQEEFDVDDVCCRQETKACLDELMGFGLLTNTID